MVIKFSINQNINVFGKNKSECAFNFEYNYQGNLVKVSSEGEFLEDELELPSTLFLYKVKKIQYEVTTKKSFEVLDDDELLTIAKTLADIHNNLLRRLRQFGGGKHLESLRVNKSNLNAQLNSWNLKLFDGTKEIKPLAEPTLIEMYYLGYDLSYHPYISSTSLPIIKEALTENFPEIPDNEIKTKAEEFVDKGEFRLALLESVMCLETALNNFITVYYKNSSKSNITEPDMLKKFPVPLKTKLSVVLDHLISPTYYKGISVENVFSAISKRNEVVHVGTVDIETKYPNIEVWVKDTIKLCDALIRSAEQINYTPIKTEIANEFDAVYHKKPTIWVFKTHSYLFEILTFDKFSEDEMKKMSEKLSDIVKSKDAKFDPKKNLTVNFKHFLGNKIIGIWDRGQLVIERAEDYIGSASTE